MNKNINGQKIKVSQVTIWGENFLSVLTDV